MAKANTEQYPHVRALKVCLACGREKAQGLLVCWPCHNDLKCIYDDGYGPDVMRVIITANEQIASRQEC